MSDQTRQAPALFTEIKEEIIKILNSTIDDHLKHKVYSPTEVQNWTNNITEDAVKLLQQISDNFKFIVSCVVMQKKDPQAGLHLSSSCFWNMNTDGNIALKWENHSLHCIINVYALSL